MDPIIADILRVLETTCDESAREDALLNAAFLFEKRNGLPYASGWTRKVVEANPSPEDFSRLKGAVIRFVEQSGFGCWTLSKCQDLSLKPLFIRVVEQQLERDAGELFQAMIALSQLGEPVFGEERSHCILDESHNRELARTYLRHLR